MASERQNIKIYKVKCVDLRCVRIPHAKARNTSVRLGSIISMEKVVPESGAKKLYDYYLVSSGKRTHR